MRDDDWNLVLYDVGFPDRETQVARLSSLITIYKALTSILAFQKRAMSATEIRQVFHALNSGNLSIKVTTLINRFSTHTGLGHFPLTPKLRFWNQPRLEIQKFYVTQP